MFPREAAGIALFALRVSVMMTLLFDGVVNGSHASSAWSIVGLATTGILLCLGLFTPYISILCVLIQAVLLHRLGGREEFHLGVNIVNSLILAVLGPGAYSIDALLFGRRLLVVPPRR